MARTLQPEDLERLVGPSPLRPHDCLRHADHTAERGSFCTICDRFILLAEFT